MSLGGYEKENIRVVRATELDWEGQGDRLMEETPHRWEDRPGGARKA